MLPVKFVASAAMLPMGELGGTRGNSKVADVRGFGMAMNAELVAAIGDRY
jgi:hypothetical protein